MYSFRSWFGIGSIALSWWSNFYLPPSYNRSTGTAVQSVQNTEFCCKNPRSCRYKTYLIGPNRQFYNWYDLKFTCWWSMPKPLQVLIDRSPGRHHPCGGLESAELYMYCGSHPERALLLCSCTSVPCDIDNELWRRPWRPCTAVLRILCISGPWRPPASAVHGINTRIGTRVDL